MNYRVTTTETIQLCAFYLISFRDSDKFPAFISTTVSSSTHRPCNFAVNVLSRCTCIYCPLYAHHCRQLIAATQRIMLGRIVPVLHSYSHIFTRHPCLLFKRTIRKRKEKMYERVASLAESQTRGLVGVGSLA